MYTCHLIWYSIFPFCWWKRWLSVHGWCPCLLEMLAQISKVTSIPKVLRQGAGQWCSHMSRSRHQCVGFLGRSGGPCSMCCSLIGAPNYKPGPCLTVNLLRLCLNTTSPSIINIFSPDLHYMCPPIKYMLPAFGSKKKIYRFYSLVSVINIHWPSAHSRVFFYMTSITVVL